MTQTITIPNPPTSKTEAIACFTALGQALKVAMIATEDNIEWVNYAKRSLLRAHGDLNRGGYLLEDLFGVPDDTFGAGGGNKPF
jgi:hypothetical protein